MSLPSNEMPFQHPLFRRGQPQLMRGMKMASYISSSEKKEKAARNAEESRQAASQSSCHNSSPRQAPMMVLQQQQQQQQQQSPSVIFQTLPSTPSSSSPASIRTEVPAVAVSSQGPMLERPPLQGLVTRNTQQQLPPTLSATQPSLHHQAQSVQQILASQQLMPLLQQELSRQVLGIQRQQNQQQQQLSTEVLLALLSRIQPILPRLQPNSHPVLPAPTVSMSVMPLASTSSSAATASGFMPPALWNTPGPAQSPDMDAVAAAAIRVILQQQTQTQTSLTLPPSTEHSLSGPTLMQLLRSAIERQQQQQQRERQSQQEEREAVLQIILATMHRNSVPDRGDQL
jgi:hypothetical protein